MNTAESAAPVLGSASSGTLDLVRYGSAPVTHSGSSRFNRQYLGLERKTVGPFQNFGHIHRHSGIAHVDSRNFLSRTRSF